VKLYRNEERNEDKNKGPQIREFNLTSLSSFSETLSNFDDEKDDPTTADEFLNPFSEDYEWIGGHYRGESIIEKIIVYSWVSKNLQVLEYDQDSTYDYDEDSTTQFIIYDPLTLELDEEELPKAYLPEEESEEPTIIQFAQEEPEEPTLEDLLLAA